jgi:nucleoid-associated protein YgaU
MAPMPSSPGPLDDRHHGVRITPTGAPAAVALSVVLVAGACVPTPAGRATAAPPAVPPSITPSATPTPTPTGPTPSPSFIRPTPLPLPTFTTYVVQPGDTLTSIARAFSTTALSVAYWNRTAYPSLDPDSASYQPDRIEVGWVLLIQPNVKVDELDLP